MSYTVRDIGNVLELIEIASAEVCAKFTKPGHGMTTMGGVFSYKPMKINLETAKEHFERHLARNPARNVSTAGERINT